MREEMPIEIIRARLTKGVGYLTRPSGVWSDANIHGGSVNGAVTTAVTVAVVVLNMAFSDYKNHDYNENLLKARPAASAVVAGHLYPT